MGGEATGMRHGSRTGHVRQGLSLIELLVALAISAILATLGWPLLTRQRAATAVSVATNRTLAALHTARQLALATGHSVTVCPSPDGRRCTFGAGHWMLFENRPGGRDSTRESSEPILQRWQLPAGVVSSGTRGYAAYQPAARSATTLTFRFCHRSAPQAGRSVIISQTGRPRASGPNRGECTR
jgi:type IV fimbrial biogenesis protein FimT